ncbi:hypothetical protein BU16DRAFT_215437 [Lophium mytilinum]|uniref:Uncharacterized protein n=1 Tax=Lophium mytilinum TaxID=390894 RepID=A0A6A6QBN8_9PEZI|nr:hypothetical protein BU16DRAFT_215437 [Lophium mytilinum]
MNQHFDLANGSVHSRNTPPRETPPTEGSRPQSYAAPESWNIHDPHSQHNSWNNQEQPSQHDVNMTPPRTLGAPDRLGVLPSPAKSAFSLAQAERDGEVPPVPPIPSDMEGWQQQHEREREIQSHRNLQSVIRHSTPPVTDALRTQSTDLAASQQPVDQQAEQAVGQHAETRAEYEKKEPSWPLVSNPPSPDKMDELPQAPMSGQAQVYDEDDQPPQLSHNLLPTSRAIPGHVHAEEVDDNDRPPQLHYEALPASAPPGQLHRSADVSPTSGPQASDHGDISPVVSSDDHDASDDDDDRAPPPLDLSFLSSNSQPTRDRLANISPVAAARQASVASDGAPAAIRPDGREGTSTPTPRPAYETEQIGVGDVSPVSSRGNDFAGTATDEPTPTKAVVGPSDGRPVVAPVNVTAPRQPFASNAAAVANTTYKGVDDDYEPSRSSLDSWENGSVEEQLSLRDDRPSAARHYSQEGVATVVTPQSAKTVQVGSYFRPQGVEQAQATIPQAAQPSTQHERVPQVIAREPSQPSQVSAFAGAHRSQSLLSTISKAVSAEGVADSPVSDRSGRAGDIPLLPQTLHVPAQQRNSEHLSPIHDDGFDLYADHNGIVKDLHDERTGEPVRIPPMPSAPAPQPPRQQPSPIVTPVPKQETHRSVESPVTRRGGNMGSRPMSFVSLPRDAKGRPQEQINREMYPEDGEREQLSGQPASPQVSSSVQQPLASAPTSPRAQEQNDHVSPPLGPPAPSFAPPLVALATSKAVGRGLTDGERQPQALAPPQPVAPMQGQQDPLQGRGGSVLPQQQAVGQLPPQGQSRQDSRMHDPKVQDPRLQDPRLLNDPKVQQLQTQDRRMQDSRIQDPRMQIGDPRVQAPPGQTVGPMGPGQPIFRDPRQQGTAPGQLYSPQDPRLQGRTPGQVSPQDPRMQGAQFPPPRNEYEAQQQMMARQAMDPRLLGAEYQLPGVGPPAREGQANTPDSGRPKLGSVFKKLGSRQTPPPAQVTPNDRINPQLMSPDDQHRAFSYQSSVGDLPTEQIRDKKKERKSSIFTSTNSRPQSVGTASQFSQESRVAHAADSRVDLRYPTSPAPFKGIPPQVPPPGAPQPPKPQPQRASTSLLPDGGKKRRFSGLGSLFGRHGSTGHVPPTKPQKLSKEEKKRQKAPIQQPQQLQNPTQGYGQPPVFPQQYAPQPQQPRAGPGMPSPQGAQQYIPPQQQGMPLQYLPQGVQGYAPQRTSMQPPPGAQGYGVPTQQYYGQPPNPSEAYRQPQYPPSAQRGQQTLPFPAQTSPGSQQYPSAYGETRLLAQSATQQPPSFPPSVSPIPPPQSRQMSPQNSRPGPPPTNPSFEHTVGRINEEGETPPPGGFYAPGRFSHDHGNVGYGAIAQEAATSPHPQNQRRVSSPTSMHGSTNGLSSPVSQRSVSSPISEPRYETPQIPAAYSNGAAKYAAPTARTPSLPNQLATAARKSSSPSPYNGPVRQYSDSHRPAMGSPQVSGQSQYDSAAAGDHRGSTSPRVVSPVSNPSPGRPPQQIQQGKSPRMGSISEATRSHQERPYNISLPIDEGVENEAAYIKHQQMLQQQMEAQNQAQVSRNGNTPSPNPPQGHGRPISTQGTTGALAGFKEVLPRHSPQPYQIPPPQQQHSSPHSQQMQLQQHPHSRTPEPAQPAPIRPSQLQAGGPVQPAAYPLPMSPDLANAASPVNPMTAMLPPPPPPSVPHEKIVPHHHNNDVTADEAPPSYSTHEQPSQIFNDEKTYPPQSPTLQPPPPQMPPPSHIPAPQPPPQQEYVPGDGPNERGRKPSLSILQHPQPSTMAASPSRSSIEMGSAILRQRLLEQEERERVERLQKSELERVESERERAERDRARARARELERSRGSVRGYHMGAIGSSGQRPVAFELSAEEDEPVMRGVSYPGMEWTPAWEGD